MLFWSCSGWLLAKLCLVTVASDAFHLDGGLSMVDVVAWCALGVAVSARLYLSVLSLLYLCPLVLDALTAATRRALAWPRWVPLGWKLRLTYAREQGRLRSGSGDSRA